MDVVTKPKPVFFQPKLLPQKSEPKSAAQTHNFQNGSLRNKLCSDLLGTRIEPRKSTIRIKIGTYSVRLSFGVFLTITNSILRADTSSPAILSLKSLISIFKSANQITSKMGSNLNRFPKFWSFKYLKISLTPRLNILKFHSEFEMNSWCLTVLTSLSPWLCQVLF